MKEIVKLTSDLIKFQTTKENPKELQRCVDYVAKQLPKRLHITKGINKGKPYIIASVKKTKKPKLLLEGHLDVVEAEPGDFKPKVKGKKLYGRGSYDMKSGCAIAIQLLKEEKEKDIALMLTTDEEIGGEDGVGHLYKQWNPRLVIATEPSNYEITIKNKGILWLKVTAKGKAGHGSTPWNGENAIDKLMDKYQKIKKMFPKPNKKRWTATLNLGWIKSGEAYNKVPAEAEMGLDIRYTEHDDVNKIIKKIRNLKGIKVETPQKQPMRITDIKEPHMQKLKKVFEKVTKKKARFKSTTGGSDTRFFAGKGIVTTDFGVKGKNLHAPNEWADIKSMGTVYKILKEFIKTL
ncbi:MAG: M20/M25/M40 family metallo-hydrolase [Nanoarchaeota archaeon]|nr:M20/M25/M40 family metallo-hydrolase [Nanoarchaeota archaeon]MCG2718959.1 M20/M25/M40 family metallo-hydrolase [Nanoarchaeota archaeon]